MTATPSPLLNKLLEQYPPEPFVAKKKALSAPQVTPLELETRPTVETAAAANYLHLAPQTLRIWACKETGPLRPRRINGRLHWATAEIRSLLGVA